MSRFVSRTAMIGLIAVLGACAATDPLRNPHNWRPTGVNERNIAAQVANPGDLFHGRELPAAADGDMAAAAILRLRTDHVKPLPDSAITDLKVEAAPTSQGSQ